MRILKYFGAAAPCILLLPGCGGGAKEQVISDNDVKVPVMRERQNISDQVKPTPTPIAPSVNQKSIAGPNGVIITDRLPSTDHSIQVYNFTGALTLSDIVSAPLSSKDLDDVIWDFAELDAPSNLYYSHSTNTPQNNDRFDAVADSSFRLVATNPLSTFSSDVDTASYTILRNYLNDGKIPPKNSIRLEELINYFEYDYPQPTNEHPISIDTEVTASPWNPEHRLVRIGLQGKKIPIENRPFSNLVFLIDSSGSMNEGNRIELLKKCLLQLVETLDSRDTISIVTYADIASKALDSTRCDQKDKITSTINSISASGSTNGEGGIQMAYDEAVKNYLANGINRVILCTDGDFNVGASSDAALVEFIKEKAESGIDLSVLGFGNGNFNDAMIEKITNAGNGNYAFIDSEKEGYRTLVENASGTLLTIAKDVKIQVEFNPDKVQAYKLIGYENRALQNHEFTDDKKDAGDIGSGHQVTALYEIIPSGLSTHENISNEPLRYEDKGDSKVFDSNPVHEELLHVKVRYKKPDEENSTLVSRPVIDDNKSLSELSDNTLLCSTVAAFGMYLREEETVNAIDLEIIKNLLQAITSEKAQNVANELAELIMKIEEFESLSND